MENNTENACVENNEAMTGTVNNDSSLKGILLFLYICAVNILSVAVSLGYWFLDHNHWTEEPSVFELFLLLCNFIFIVTYTVKCCRQRLYKQLKGITYAFMLTAVCSVVISGIFFPILDAGYIICCFLTNAPQPEGGLFVFIVNMLVLGISALVLFLSVYVEGEAEPRKKPYLLSLKQITLLISAFCLCFLVLYGFAFAKYELDYDFLGENLHSETPRDEYLSSITAEQKNIYDAIRGGDDAEITEKLLISNGFIDSEYYLDNYSAFDSIEEYFDYNYFLSDYHNEYIFSQLKNCEFSLYLYINEMEEVDYDWDDIVSYIIIAYDNSGKINYKMFIPSVSGNRYQNYTHGEETRKWFDKLQKGENAQEVLEYIIETDSCIIEDERYDGENSRSTFIIEFWCYHPLEASFADFIFNRSSGYNDYYYNFEIKTENGIIADFQELVEE